MIFSDEIQRQEAAIWVAKNQKSLKNVILGFQFLLKQQSFGLKLILICLIRFMICFSDLVAIYNKPYPINYQVAVESTIRCFRKKNIY